MKMKTVRRYDGEIVEVPEVYLNDAWVSEIATHIRKVLKMLSSLAEPYDDAGDMMIDLINHADTLAQQLEGVYDGL